MAVIVHYVLQERGGSSFHYLIIEFIDLIGAVCCFLMGENEIGKVSYPLFRGGHTGQGFPERAEDFMGKANASLGHGRKVQTEDAGNDRRLEGYDEGVHLAVELQYDGLRYDRCDEIGFQLDIHFIHDQGNIPEMEDQGDIWTGNELLF